MKASPELTSTLTKIRRIFLEMPRATRHRLAWIAAACAALAYYPRFAHDYPGLTSYSTAARCMLDGKMPMSCAEGFVFAYPPFFAFLSVPFAFMPMWLCGIVWYAVLIGTIFVCLRLCEMLARRLFPGAWTENELAVFRTLTFVLALKFILAVLENQSFDSVAFLFIPLGLLALIDGRSAWAGAGFAVAAAMKVTPLIFLPYLLFKRRFTGAAVFVGVYAFLSVLPDIVMPPKAGWHLATWTYEVMLGPYREYSPTNLFQFWVTDSPMNQTFRAAITRIFAGVDYEQPVPVIRNITQQRDFLLTLYTVMGLYVLGIAALLFKSWRHIRLAPIDGALLVISALLLTPVSSQSHFVALLLPYAILSATLVKHRNTQVFMAAMLAASFVLATVTSSDLVGRSFTGWALWHSLPVLGTLTLVVPLGVLIWSFTSAHTGEPEVADAKAAKARLVPGEADKRHKRYG